MLRIGVLGAGHLGKIHLKLLKQIETIDLVGFHDPDRESAEQVANDMGLKYFPVMEQLMDAVDAVDIVTPTLSHYDCAVTAIRKGKHVFIEKPLTETVKEAEQLIKLVDEAGVKAQVGHVERFNPAFLSLGDHKLNPLFIETHRLAQFNPRGTDVPVVLDLMIHDIDIVLSLVQANVKKVSASGVPVVSNTPDIANARIEFDNGCVANLTASRISLKNMRKMRLFQQDAYITMDFLTKKSQIITLQPTEDANDPLAIPVQYDGKTRYKTIKIDEPDSGEINAIKMELEMFEEAIRLDKQPPVTIEDGHAALKLAQQILDQIEKNTLAL